MSEITHYSDEVEGHERNYRWPARFDMTTGGYLGISQDQDFEDTARVLLSPDQVKALLAFIAKRVPRYVR